MPKPKKKLLPKTFDALLKEGDISALKAVFDTCELDARGGYSKQTALAFYDCPDELSRWLVEQGADIDARDSYGRTPLHNRAVGVFRDIRVLLDLGADVHAVDNAGSTPLHQAAKSGNLGAVAALLERGARADAVNAAGLTPLTAGLQQCSNGGITAMASIAEQLLAATPKPKAGLGDRLKRAFSGKGGSGLVTPEMQAFVTRIGQNFEFHRQGFNPEYLDETSAGLDRLYALFGVEPVPRRIMHDGRTPIVAKPGRWQDQHEELWALLTPPSGAAATVQGEVIRIAGKVADEMARNGGGNWDADYRKMLNAFLAHIRSGVALPPPEQERAQQLARRIRDDDRAGEGLIELAVAWVALNPSPEPLPPPDYRR